MVSISPKKAEDEALDILNRVIGEKGMYQSLRMHE